MKALLALALAIPLGVVNAQPWEPVVLWDRSGAGDSSRYGITYSLGDQNQDGYADFAVWALGWGGAGQPSEALVELFHGGNLPSQLPYMTYRARPDDQQFYRFQTAGDLNGDDFIDWQIWRVPLSDPNQITFETYWGGGAADTIPDLVFHAPWTLGNISLIPTRDFNGDNFDDLYYWQSGSPDFGQFLYGGAPMDTVPDWIRHSAPGRPYEALPSGVGDLNGDGFADFYAASPAGFTAFFYGAAIPDTTPRYYWETIDAYPANVVNDLNGDGKDELVRSYSNATIAVHFGGDTLSASQNYLLTFYGNCNAQPYLSAGDINNDGYGDLISIDAGCNNLWGTLTIHLGHPWLNPEPAFIIQGRTPPLNLIGINDAAALGDVNDDGIDDLAITAFNSNFDGFRGRAVILSGDTSLTVSAHERLPVPTTFTVSVHPNPFNSVATVSLQVPLGVHDLTLTTYNVLGQIVVEEALEVGPGLVQYHYNARELPTGLYLLRVKAGIHQSTQKLMLLR